MVENVGSLWAYLITLPNMKMIAAFESSEHPTRGDRPLDGPLANSTAMGVYASSRPRWMLGSTLIPGPMVEVTVIDLMYLPFDEEGLARRSRREARRRLPPVALVERRPADRNVSDAELVGAVLDAFRLELLDDLGDVHRHGPELGVGHQATRPSALPSLPTLPIMSGVATAASKSKTPPSILATRPSLPTTSAPCGLGFASLVALGEDRYPNLFAGSVRERHAAPHLLFGLAGVDASRK